MTGCGMRLLNTTSASLTWGRGHWSTLRALWRPKRFFFSPLTFLCFGGINLKFDYFSYFSFYYCLFG